MQLSIIIVNYNVKLLLAQCLDAVLKACANINAEIFVVDNNSTDGSKDFFTGKFPSVQFIWNNSNVGFAKANNIALKRATGEYILFLNPDTIIPEDSLHKCIAFSKTKPTLGGLGVHMVDGNGNFLKESKRAFPSPLTSFFKLMGLANLFPHSKIFAKYHLGYLDEHSNHEVDVLCGAFMFHPKKVLDKVGSFDEQFFMYGEDVDLSYRIQKAGYKNYYFAETSIIHFKGESTKRGDLNYVKHFYGAMSIFVKKHYGGGKYRLFSIFIHVAIWLRAVPTAINSFFKKLSFSKSK
ncbi:glycosyltransferase family 2 protein [Ferruginibacter lapsinanis]|uniref:glycosyltransferase family 2 protein n=1 Tax=Ferruginibacter lapsinanis TaxID=563172 RepID=UPI001E4A68BC|nr:glycosyltransferase family 2 protein [Ferruginibacter lapsinanis]UEG50825.1 glycosyltransferase family 2 protein [Ferruginibacter lapsinanis]